MMRGLFQRLGTRPEQEAAILADADALASELRALRDDGRALREELSALLEAPSLDRARLDEALSSRVARLDALKARAAEAIARLHGQLVESQRRTLSSLLRRGTPAWAHARHGRGC
jgi:Spy/CpxP family protein refolding chaperone